MNEVDGERLYLLLVTLIEYFFCYLVDRIAITLNKNFYKYKKILFIIFITFVTNEHFHFHIAFPMLSATRKHCFFDMCSLLCLFAVIYCNAVRHQRF